MGKKPPQQAPRRRHLSKEDEALWDYMVASLKPIPGKKGRHVPGAENLDGVPPFEFKPDGKAGKAGGKQTALKAPVPPPPTSTAVPRPLPSTPALNVFDRKSARKLRQGRFEIEARIDLHGMRQHEAHAALTRFLFSSYRRGLRWVLVITGKGVSRREREDVEYGFGSVERGVLRKNVPMWLAEPELRAIVVSYTSAAISHGGEGALYVQLRNPERTRT
ncbi:MAG TPA: Smr/MutS family protein [Hyphomicrobium sp.]|nr:Smr/MutS family protein [Hyphomicrobium sp.]HRO49672.1 Smr/MutS family protein [Hyphomicrobium sp.]